jgi:BON domain
MSLQSAHLTVDELHRSIAENPEVEEQEEPHIHLPSPSLWPMLLSVAILVTVAGLLFFPDTPWLTIVGAPFVLIGILGWALEDPMASAHEEQAGPVYTYNPHLKPAQVLDQAQEALDNSVTVSSTAYSVHPVTVEIDQVKDNGVVMALYGKVELEAQRTTIEQAVREVPNVLDVRNFIVAEDAILPLANNRLESLRASGKLNGAKDLTVLAENFIVHLYGEVPDSAMKRMLEREMIGLPGVRVVVNHIGLNKEIPGNLGRTRNKI